MGHAGDSKTFLAVAAALMAGLVIATMLAINAKLAQFCFQLTKCVSKCVIGFKFRRAWKLYLGLFRIR